MYILVGDDGQIGPVHDTRLQSQIDLNDKNVCRKALGKRIYETFTDVVILRDNPRCVEHERQRDLLLRLQNLEHTQEDFKILQGHCRSNLSIEEIATFNEAILLTKTNSRKNEKNLQKASELRNENGNPLVRIPSVCSTTYAKVAPDEEAEGLKKELFLIEDMRIMVTANYWIDAGVCNGSIGELIHIVYLPGNGPPKLPDCLIVSIPDYTGPSCLTDRPTCVPLFPESKTQKKFIKGQTIHQRTQFQLVMAWAITIDKSQGLTLCKIMVDLEGKRNEPSLPFVAFSQTGNLENVMIDQTPGTFTSDSLNKLRKSKNFKSRLNNDKRLELLAENTLEKYSDIISTIQQNVLHLQLLNQNLFTYNYIIPVFQPQR